METAKLDRVAGELYEPGILLDRTAPVRLALLGSSTLTHLKPGIRVGALRRGFHVDIFEGPYGMYHQLLADRSSELYAFQPDVVLLSLDAHHITAGETAFAEDMLNRVRSCWQLARHELGATVIQQTALPIFGTVLGNNEHRYKSSPHSILQTLNERFRADAEQAGVHLLSVDTLAQTDGVSSWYSPAVWHRAKQEIQVKASPFYGDQVARILASIRGLSYKCMVLDLDNTLWGGVIGDDGVTGICLGPGHALGEAFASFQKYVKAMARRGVILAVCSKNDLAKAEAAFEEHPEMLLHKSDITCFVANWKDKVSNLRTIAETLNIGLDSLVFVDDNPFERNLVRQELPMVAVPELPEDPALFEETLAAAGYFEALTITTEDLNRARLYADNASRAQAQCAATDISSYLQSLGMTLFWSNFEQVSLARIVQLINKSNQFNLTTRRYTQEEVASMMSDPSVLTLQLRLTDAFGDNGIIGILIGRLTGHGELEIDTWLMSCRVLGRQVEEATLNLLVTKARELGAMQLVGFYFPTKKNALVQDHYRRLGFARTSQENEPNSSWLLSIADYAPKTTFANVVKSQSSLPEGARDERTDICPAN
jgi:FkbH-like protein